ncbi:MAG: hypothetical protein PHG16_00085 [Lachnospiraceae bacterium]|nr:hypothetical protein [Lachnospiraceae bacterium]
MDILITGNISLLTRDFLKRSFGDEHVVVAGEGKQYLKQGKASHSGVNLQSEEGIRQSRNLTYYPFSMMEEGMDSLFQKHYFERVIYLSEYLEIHGKPFGEIEKLRSLFRLCQEYRDVHAKNSMEIIYITSQEVLSENQVSRTVVLKACEELCKYYREQRHLSIKVIRCPYLIQEENDRSYINRLFGQMREKGSIELEETRMQRCEFLMLADLGEFLYRFMEDWENDVQVVNLPLGFSHTFEDLGEACRKLEPGLKVIYTGKVVYFDWEMEAQTARKEFGWFARIDFIDELPRLYRQYQSRAQPQKSRGQRLKEWLKKQKVLLYGLELILGFFLVEAIDRFMGTSVQFQYVDVRMTFIVIMASIYGVNAGIAAGVLEGFSIVLAYWAEAMNWRVIFYEPANWLVFIWYLVVGAVCGYVRDRKNGEIAFTRQEYALLEDKYEYLNQAYEDSSRHKSQYRKQIIGFRDSFGKIFQVAKRLDNVLPDKIFQEALSVLEEVLENRSIAIYTISGQETYGRLTIASHPISRNIPKTVAKSQIAFAKEVIKKGEVWRNVEMTEGHPAYLAGITRDDSLIAVIAVFDADYDQMGMYYANLIRILSGLIQIAMYRAVEYSEAVYSQQYEKGGVMKYEAFEQVLKVRQEMQADGTCTMELLHSKENFKPGISQLAVLERMIRDTDVIGRDKEGRICLILGQVDDQNIGTVLTRLESAGLYFECS